MQSQKNYTKFEDLPEFYLDAVVAVEDRRFYDHGALDYLGIARAIWTNIKSFKLRAKATVNKKKRNRLKKMNSLYLFDLLASCFYSLSRTNKLYKNIKCPLFIMFGEFDDISEPNLIGKIRKQVHHNVNVDIKFYKGANHVFIMSNKVDKIPYYNDMISFVNE